MNKRTSTNSRTFLVVSIEIGLQSAEHENTRLRRLVDETRTKADDAHSRHIRERDAQQAKFDQRLAEFTGS